MIIILPWEQPFTEIYMMLGGRSMEIFGDLIFEMKSCLSKTIWPNLSDPDKSLI